MSRCRHRDSWGSRQQCWNRAWPIIGLCTDHTLDRCRWEWRAGPFSLLVDLSNINRPYLSIDEDWPRHYAGIEYGNHNSDPAFTLMWNRPHEATRGPQEPAQAAGLPGPLLGYHADAVIVDDPKLRRTIEAWDGNTMYGYEIDELITHLDASGYVIIEKATRRRENRAHDIADADRRAAEDRHASAFAWGQREAAEVRRLQGRCSYLYALAERKGASPAELQGRTPPDVTT
jgi:hypothetical protein